MFTEHKGGGCCGMTVTGAVSRVVARNNTRAICVRIISDDAYHVPHWMTSGFDVGQVCLVYLIASVLVFFFFFRKPVKIDQ